jgi:magnesium transporter
MLSAYVSHAGRLHQQHTDPDQNALAEATWIDMIQPSKEEEQTIESLLGVEVPTPEEMRGVESSSQIYREGDATIMTIRVISNSSASAPKLTAVTFILTPAKLVTLRYGQPKSFSIFVERLNSQHELLASPKGAMVSILETIVERSAEILESVGDELDKLSECLFTENNHTLRGIAGTDLETLLQGIGRSGDLASRVRESLHSINRVIPALRRKQEQPVPDELGEDISTLRRDVTSLLDHDAYLTAKIQFLMDSNLGLISIQQNAIIKIFSVAAVIFLPPTLIASVYGMNFEHMPELKWLYGYPFAIGLMIVSSIVPYWFFKRKHWL